MAPPIARAVILTLAVLLAPLGASAQQTGEIARIGYLSSLTARADSVQREAFLEGLRTLGYVEGKNAVLEARYADARFERLPELAAEIVRLKVDVIVTAVTPSARAVQQATGTIPIVMAFSADPVGDGLVAKLARPGGNITGLSAAAGEITVKRVEVPKTIVPALSHVSYLANPQITRLVVTESEIAGRTLGLRVGTLFVRDSSEAGRTR
jgi:putative ABC transport system substrate-binding protein